jgi:hypothetical protein
MSIAEFSATDATFMMWIAEHAKSYQTLEEYSIRKMIFTEADNFIN